MRPRLRRPAVAVLVAVALLLRGRGAAAEEGWATSQATELTRQGEEHAAHGEVATAVRRFLDAIAFDATYGPAYLALGAVQEKAGDAREAERAYAMGLEHVNGFAAGHLARARLRLRHARFAEGVADLEAAAALAPEELPVLKELARAYLLTRALPAALATARRIEAVAAARQDAGTLAEARADERALSGLVAEADPVTSARRGRGEVRSALAARALGGPRRKGAP